MSRRRQIRWRIKLAAWVLCISYAVLVVRAVDLQVLRGDVFFELAERQQRRTLKTLPHRGAILDRTGKELAVSMFVDSIYANPSSVTEPAKTAREVARITGQDRGRIERLLRRRGQFVWLDRLVEPEVANRLREADLEGIGFVKESKRYYPNGPLMGQVLGFVGLDAVGLEGLERRYDKYLRGSSEVMTLQKDALNRAILTHGLDKKLNGNAYQVELTVDKAITYEAQRALDEAVEKYDAKNGVAIVQDVKTGAILAMVVAPAFDPNRFSDFGFPAARNRAVADVYEPGSTIKPFVLAAALQEEKVTLNSLIYCENGSYEVADRRIRDTHEHGWLTASKVVKVSSNIGALKMSRMLGAEKWHRYLESFGLTRKTGIDLPGEAKGLMRPLFQWNEVLLATTSYGQGMGSTPLQVVNAMSALANGGLVMRPFIVKRVVDENGATVFENQPQILSRPITPEVAEQVTGVLETVVEEEGGTGTQAAVPGYRVAGKTGTAQKVDPETGLYSRTDYLATFAGYLPADDPEIAILVTLNEPQDQIYGGIVAAPVFSQIGAKAMERLRIPSDVPSVFAHGEGQQLVVAGDEVEAKTVEGKFFGLTLREALREAREDGIALVADGSGWAVQERCADAVCEVKFSSEWSQVGL